MAAELKIIVESSGGGGSGGGGGGGASAGGGRGGGRLSEAERAERARLRAEQLQERERARVYASIVRRQEIIRRKDLKEQQAQERARSREERDRQRSERAAERQLPFAREIREPALPFAREIREPRQPTGGPRGSRSGLGFLGRQFVANAIGAAVGGIGTAGAGIAQNDPGAAISSVARTASLGLAALGPKGFVAAAALQATVGAVTAFRETVNAFVARGRELSGLSGTLASATAQADVRKLQADLREAQQVGPAMARLIEVQSKADAAVQRLLEPIKIVITEKLTVFLETSLKFMLGVLEFVDGLKAALGGPGLVVLSPLLGGLAAITDLKSMIRDIRDILRGTAGPSLITDWLNALSGFVAPAAPAAPVGAPPLGRLVPGVVR